MANGFGSLFIGVSGLQNSQQALNVTANNLANVDTAGYVRQQVLFSDRDYLTFNTTAAISKQQSGLGVKIGDVIHTRDIFLDRSYRTESSREAFYASTAEAAQEVETYFQEMEGQTFQSAMEDLWKAFQTFSTAPDEEIYQNLVIQKAQLFLDRGNAVYSGLQSFQYNINQQIRDDVDQINALGNTIFELNQQIQKIEAGGIETAMTLRDARDQALDELSSLASISYTELADGMVKVSIEGTEFVDEARCYEMGLKTDKVTGFETPYWPHLSDTNKGKYTYVFNFSADISAENKNDAGELKALVLARGDHIANYNDVLGVDKDTFNDTTGMSVMMKAEAELDQMMHGIMTAINDLLCPNTEASNYFEDGETSVTVTGKDGQTYEITDKTLILDMDNCSVGQDKSLPPQEMFTRVGTERYTEATYSYNDPVTGDPKTKTIYIYNEEDPSDTSKQYTMQSTSVNEALVISESAIPHLTQDNYTVNYSLAESLAAVWEKELLTLNPNDTKAYSFKDYYAAMTGEMATFGDVYQETASSLSGTVLSVDNQRQQVIGVSSDEELTYMIRYQNAYNASSRFINVINEMIEHLITQMG